MPTIDPLTLLDPELKPALDAILPLFPALDGPFDAAALAGFRARMIAKPRLAAPAVETRRVPAPSGVEVSVLVVNAGGERRPAILHMHGGGYIAGSAEDGVADLQVLAHALDCVVVSVDYRLAPETPFPGSLHDNLAALRWLRTEAAALGVDPARVAIMGESAGGGHAAMLAIAARDAGDPPLLLQALTYPMLDDRTASSRTAPPHIGTWLWRPELNVAGWTALLGRPPGGEAAPAGAVPARLGDLAGLPPTFIAVGTLDLFVEEDIDFARRLVAAGVPTELIVLPGAFHASDAVAPATSVSRRQRRALYNALARALGRPELNEPPPPAPFPDWLAG